MSAFIPALLAAMLLVAIGSGAPRLSASAAPAATAGVLYDGAAGTYPEAQGWTYVDASFGGATRALGGGAATLDTMASNQIRAGYSASAAGYLGSTAPVPVLNRTTGYTVTFTVQVEQEDHSAASADKNNDGVADRAGFTATVIGEDRRGIELGFWLDQVWAQEGGAQEPPGGTLFTHAEGAALDTTAARTYSLAIRGDTYRLVSGGATVLTGKLRDYTAFDSQGQPDPYETPSFLFFGDGSASARARARLAHVAVTVGSAKPVYLPLIARR